ncbi:hypothetical protein QR680_014032 [Steinernema hermaphroditum]|uniref:E3 UFM1-protein ligase 1 homolog n=1 Tax=Steinernema hermaphroditum TaxID=289476 RepID=A0AA39M2I8_9BILA|nr:hypothetical protein QR680_014032 [Steinernema hermaphroditum]
MTTWADIKKLAADLQRAQLVVGAKKLSERNCIELVHKLATANVIDLVFTTDGKEYVTKKHLVTEIRNECLARGGHTPIGDIAAALRVEFGQIEAQIGDTVADDEFFVCSGEVFSRRYIRELCAEVNSKLQELGSLSLQHLTKTMQIPTEVIHNHILPNVGSTIDANQSGDTLYASAYLRSQRNTLRAVLSAITRVTPLPRIQQSLNVSPSLFSSLWNELQDVNAVPGRIIGNKNSANALYVPNVHDRMVRQCTVKNFHENRIVNFDALKKMFVVNQHDHLKQVFPDLNQLVIFQNFAISRELWEEVEQAISDEMAKTDYCNLANVLPPTAPFEDADIKVAGQLLVKKHMDWKITETGLCYDKCIIKKIVNELDDFIAEKAQIVAFDYVRQLRHKPKKTTDDDDCGTKATRKKKGGKQSKQVDEPKEHSVSVTIPIDEVQKEIKVRCKLPEDLVDAIGDEVMRHVHITSHRKVEAALLNIHQHEHEIEQYVLKTLHENRIIDFGVLKKMLVPDPPAYLVESLHNRDLVILWNCAVSSELWGEVEKTVANEVAKADYCNLVHVMPSAVPFEDVDIKVAGQMLLKKHTDWGITEGGLCYDIRKIVNGLDGFIAEKAEAMAPDYVKQLRQKSETDSKKAADDDNWDTNAEKKKKGKKQKGGKQPKPVEKVLKSRYNLPEETTDAIGDDIKRHVDIIFRQKVEADMLGIVCSAL